MTFRQLTTASLVPLCSFAYLASASQPLCGRGLPSSPLLAAKLVSIDETNTGRDPTSWSPWTHKPRCVEAADSPFCVFTNSDPAIGGLDKGISIITTPEKASGSMNLLEHITLSHAPPRDKSPKRPYAVRDVLGKGKGTIATAKIAKGQTILVDHVLVLSVAEYPDDVLRTEVQELLGTAVEQLSEPERIYELSRKGRNEEEGFSEVEDLLLSNSFLVEVAGGSYMGLFPDLARVNHACNSNALMHFSEKTLAMTIVAARDIEPGEEITISYIDTGLPYSERQETLHTIWGFNCTCSLCSAPPEARKASDARRTEIQILKEKVIRLAQRGEFHKAIDNAENLFAVIDEEGLTASMTDMYEIPARLYYQVGNLEKASDYTKRSLRALEEGFEVVPGSKEEKKIDVLRKVLARIEAEMEEEKRREDEIEQKKKEGGKKKIDNKSGRMI
ncbi:hypothetical protein B0H66DRAFT_483703 [Apodospora peruviana]|uniref:SET domain-containing protein n=1 Tax=Apodospora peruviana TaxID=516989 RepID=A0AAE0M0E6_9PEZI|nr:hypothetical protein B0H66DRAFT_483703 [Apodospora peruviana]